MTYRLSLFLLILLPFQFALPLAPGVDIPLARLIAAMIFATFLIERFFSRQWCLPEPVFSSALISFLGIALCTFFFSLQPDWSIPKIVFLFNLFPLVFVWYTVSLNRLQFLVFIRAGVYGAAGAAILGITIFLLQFIFGVSAVFHALIETVLPFFLGHDLGAQIAQYPSLLVNIQGETMLRVTALFPDPHVAAYYFGMFGFLALGLLQSSGKRVYLAFAGVLFLADALTFSRGGYIGLIAGGLAYILVAAPALSRRVKTWIGSATLAGILIMTFIGQPVLQRFLTSFSAADTSSQERLALWSEALSAITQHPLLGVGLGNYLAVARPLYPMDTPFYAHNLYLDVAVEMGLIGLGLFLILLGSAFSRGIGQRRDPCAAALVAAATLYAAHSMFETALFSIHVTIVLVLLFALANSLQLHPSPQTT